MAPWSYKLKRHKRGAVRLNFKLKLNIKEIMVKNKKKELCNKGSFETIYYRKFKTYKKARASKSGIF